MNFLKPGLYLISTPIGNLEDITLRSLEILRNSDIILCEDTRRSLKLLNHYNIKKKLVPYHKFNEKKELNKVIKYLNEGRILSLISDAGTPLLSDPGHLLVRECLDRKISVYPIPGPSSITTSMSVSGFEDKFVFYGFLPKKEKELKKILLNLKDLNFSIIFFVPGIKINFYLKHFKSYFFGRNLFIARELTKIHETFYRESVDKIKLFSSPLKGEVTIVISKKYNKNELSSDSEIIKQAMMYLKKYSLKDVVDLISKKEKVSKNKVYQICLGIKKNEKNS